MNADSLESLYYALLLGLLLLGLATLYGALRNLSPYGRLRMDTATGASLPSLPAWLLFESPQLFAFALTFWLSAEQPGLPALLLFALWQGHYLYRGAIYPLRRRAGAQRFPLLNVIFGFVFNLMNGWVNGYAVSHAAHLQTPDWFLTPWFMAGLVLALVGWGINFQADNILIRLRSDATKTYRIPQGGFFRYVSAANYLGEILLWCGWALMSLTLAGLMFVLFSLANLVPRALQSHRWYQQTFPDYPPERRAIFPFLL